MKKIIKTKGPSLYTEESRKFTSGETIKMLMNGAMPLIPNFSLPMIDVRDFAQSQISALKKGESGKRYIIASSENCMFLRDMSLVLLEEFRGMGYSLRTRNAPKFIMWMAKLFFDGISEILPFYGRDKKFRSKYRLSGFEVKFKDMRKSLLEMAHHLIDIGYIKDRRPTTLKN